MSLKNDPTIIVLTILGPTKILTQWNKLNYYVTPTINISIAPCYTGLSPGHITAVNLTVINKDVIDLLKSLIVHLKIENDKWFEQHFSS